MGSMPISLSLERVRVCFGTHVAVDSLTLGVHRGEIVALVGPNGSGKSTTLSLAAGLYPTHEGRITIDGICRAADPVRYAHRVGYVPQDHSLYDELTASQNLEFFGKLYGLRGFTLDANICRGLLRAKLTEHSEKRVGTFSGGMKQRLSIAIATMHDPIVVLLDEPTASLDASSRDDLFAELHRLREDGHAILLTTHHAEEAEIYCDRVAVLERGKLLTDGRPHNRSDSKSAGKLVVYGHLREAIPKFMERRLRNRLMPGIEFEILGRRVRLTAETSQQLGRALAVVLAEGLPMELFRTTSFSRETATRVA
jgi:ABC-2 type transport system ATP-binding protein